MSQFNFSDGFKMTANRIEIGESQPIDSIRVHGREIIFKPEVLTYTEAEMEAKQWKVFKWLHFKLLGYNPGTDLDPTGHGGKNLYDQYLKSLNTPKP